MPRTSVVLGALLGLALATACQPSRGPSVLPRAASTATPAAQACPLPPAPPLGVSRPSSTSRANAPGFDRVNVPFERMTAEARSSGKPAILYFCASWCGYCTKMNRETLSDASVQRRIHDFPASLYDPDTPEGRAVANRFGVDAFPTMVLVDGNGREVDQVVGARPAADLLAQLARH